MVSASGATKGINGVRWRFCYQASIRLEMRKVVITPLKANATYNGHLHSHIMWSPTNYGLQNLVQARRTIPCVKDSVRPSVDIEDIPYDSDTLVR